MAQLNRIGDNLFPCLTPILISKDLSAKLNFGRGVVYGLDDEILCLITQSEFFYDSNQGLSICGVLRFPEGYKGCYITAPPQHFLQPLKVENMFGAQSTLSEPCLVFPSLFTFSIYTSL